MPRKRPQRRSSNFRLRVAIFAVLALALAGGATYALAPKERAFIELDPSPPPPAMGAMEHGTPAPVRGTADLTMRIDMGGFTPAQLPVPAGRSQRLLLVNPDNSHHTDGGGVHQFAVPQLGIDVKVPPLTNMVITLPAAEPGDYSFYCDTCCGGKENPSMQGVLKVRA